MLSILTININGFIYNKDNETSIAYVAARKNEFDSQYQIDYLTSTNIFNFNYEIKLFIISETGHQQRLNMNEYILMREG